MRLLALISVLATSVAVTACGGGAAPAAPAPTAVGCGDAPQLRQRAIDDRRQSAELSSDQERIYVGNRANFFASLAIIADLECKVAPAAADEALKPAFEAARKAESTRSMYERAFRWGEADFIASQVIDRLIPQLVSGPHR